MLRFFIQQARKLNFRCLEVCRCYPLCKSTQAVAYHFLLDIKTKVRTGRKQADVMLQMQRACLKEADVCTLLQCVYGRIQKCVVTLQLKVSQFGFKFFVFVVNVHSLKCL